MTASLLLVLCTGTALLFRFGQVGMGLAASCFTVLVAVVVGIGGRRAVLHAAASLGKDAATPAQGSRVKSGGLLLLLASTIALLGVIPGIWPCEVDCQSALDYRTLFGLRVLGLAAAAYLVTALLLLASTRHTLPAELCAWLLVGSSLYFVWLSVDLRMTCGHCLSIHTAVLASLAGLLQGSSGWITRSACVAIAAVSLPQLYAWDLRRALREPASTELAPTSGGTAPGTQVPSTAGTTTAPPLPPDATVVSGPPGATAPDHAPADPPVESELLPDGRSITDAADAGRRLGTGNNKLRIELVMSFNCGHCAEEFGPIEVALRPLLGDGKAELVIYHLHPRKEKQSVELLKYAFAAAACGRYREFAAKVFAVRSTIIMEGTSKRPATSDPGPAAEIFERMRNQDALSLERVKQLLDLAPEEALVASHARALEKLIQADDREIARLEANGEMPQLFLVDPANGAILERLDQRPSIPKVVEAVRKQLAR